MTRSCLRAIRRLQQFGHLPSDFSIFKSYAVAGNFYDVRIEALQALVDFTKGNCLRSLGNSAPITSKCFNVHVELLYRLCMDWWESFCRCLYEYNVVDVLIS